MHTTTWPLRTVMAASLRVWEGKKGIRDQYVPGWNLHKWAFPTNVSAFSYCSEPAPPVKYIMQFCTAMKVIWKMAYVLVQEIFHSAGHSCSKWHVKHLITECLSALSTSDSALWHDTSVTREKSVGTNDVYRVKEQDPPRWPSQCLWTGTSETSPWSHISLRSRPCSQSARFPGWGVGHV